MDEEIQTKTIGLAETIFLVLLVGAEEFMEVIILLVTLGTGIIVVEIMNVATAILMEMYMLFRGGTGVKRLLIQPLGAFFDGILGTILPIKTLAMVIGIWMINNSEKIEKLTGPAGTVVMGGVKGAAAQAGRQAVATEARMAAASMKEVA